MLTSAQLALLKADIAANTNTIDFGGTPTQIKDLPNNGDANIEIANWYNGTASPDFWAWRSFVPDQEIYSSASPDATTWSWTTFIGRSQGERDAWRQMVNMAGGLNPSLANTRAGVADIFSGAGGANQRAFLLSIGRRKATRIEKLFKTAGAGSTADPATSAYSDGFTLQGNDVTQARNS